MYRVISRTQLDNGLKYGDLVGERDDMNIPALLRAGRLERVSSPPLSAVPGLANITPKLEAIGITNVQQFIDADIDELFQLLSYRTKSPIARYQKIAFEAMKAPEQIKKGG